MFCYKQLSFSVGLKREVSVRLNLQCFLFAQLFVYHCLFFFFVCFRLGIVLSDLLRLMASNYLFTIFKKCLLHNKNVTSLKIITFACYLTKENMSPPSRDVRNIYSSRVYIYQNIRLTFLLNIILQTCVKIYYIGKEKKI